MNYTKYLNYLVTPKDTEDFYDFQKKDIAWLKEKIIRTEGETKKDREIFKEDFRKKENLKNLYLQQIDEQKNQNLYKSMSTSTFSHYQPSTNFLNLIYEERKKHFQELNEAERKFAPQLSLISLNQRKTRFGASPVFNTKTITESNPKSALFISEENRFKIRGRDYDIFNDNNRYQKLNREKANLKKIEREHKEYNDINKFHCDYYFAKDALGQIKRTGDMLNYEIINRLQNEFIE